MPSGVYAQEKVLKQEEKLIGRLQELQLDSTMVNVLHRQANVLLEGMVMLVQCMFMFHIH